MGTLWSGPVQSGGPGPVGLIPVGPVLVGLVPVGPGAVGPVPVRKGGGQSFQVS